MSSLTQCRIRGRIRCRNFLAVLVFFTGQEECALAVTRSAQCPVPAPALYSARSQQGRGCFSRIVIIWESDTSDIMDIHGYHGYPVPLLDMYGYGYGGYPKWISKMDIHVYYGYPTWISILDMYGCRYGGYPKGYQKYISILDVHVHYGYPTWIS